MLRYLLRRILLFIPTLLVISLLAFGLSKVAPGDPVELLLRGGAEVQGTGRGNPEAVERVYAGAAKRLGLDKPPFYISLSSRAYPDTLYRITRKDYRETLHKLIAQYGNWPEIQVYIKTIGEVEQALRHVPDTIAPQAVTTIRQSVQQLYVSYADAKIQGQFNKMAALLDEFPKTGDALFYRNRLEEQLADLQQQYSQVQETATPSKLYVPDVKWHGLDNQYHNWFVNFLKGDFGISYLDQRPVWHKLKDALFWTLILNALAVIFAYGLSIPLGVWSAVKKGSSFDRATTITLFILYSLPTFWIATMLVVFFTTPEYGRWLDIFPSVGLGSLRSDAPFWSRFWEVASHLILPVFCLTYASLAIIARQVRGAMLDTLRHDYIRTARAKGVPENTVIWKHAFRNALFPLITLFASVFPAALAGSVILEYIFLIPGMGKLVLDSITARDWPTVFAILMLGAVLTMVGILIADILYALADPRVAYGKKNK